MPDINKIDTKAAIADLKKMDDDRAMDSTFATEGIDNPLLYIKSSIALLKMKAYRPALSNYLIKNKVQAIKVSDPYNTLRVAIKKYIESLNDSQKYNSINAIARDLLVLKTEWESAIQYAQNELATDALTTLDSEIRKSISIEYISGLTSQADEFFSANKNNSKLYQTFPSQAATNSKEEEAKADKEYEDTINEGILILDELLSVIKSGALDESIGTMARGTGAKVTHGANGVVDKATEISVKEKKAREWFDDKINRVVKDIRNERQKQQYDKLVNHSLSVSREITRVLYTLPIFLINPAIGSLIFVASIFLDKHIDKKYANKMLGDLKHSERILEERINNAKDAKEKEHYMTEKDKVTRAIEKMQRSGYRNE